MLNKGVILRIILVLILVGVGFGILEYVKNIRAGAKANIALQPLPGRSWSRTPTR